MSKKYVEQSGKRNECTVVDSEQVMAALNQGKFLVSTNASTYAPEQYTISYIGSIFSSLKKVEDFWNKSKQSAGRFIEDFESVPEPKEIPLKTDFLDEVEDLNTQPIITGNLGVASIIASSLKIRKESNTNSNVIDYCNSGDKFKIIGYSNDGNWVKIQMTNGQEGYIAKKYVSIDNASSQEKIDIPTNTPSSEKVEPIEEIDTKNTPNETITPVEEPKNQEETKIDIPETEDNLTFGIVNTNNRNLNVRNEKGQIIGSLKNNSSVKILNTTSDGQWYDIEYNDGQKGRVYSKYISTDNSSTPSVSSNPTSIPSSNSLNGTVVTRKSNLNVRTDASINSSVIGSLPRNEKVEILDYDKNSNWVKINYNGKPAYVYKDFVKMEGD